MDLFVWVVVRHEKAQVSSGLAAKMSYTSIHVDPFPTKGVIISLKNSGVLKRQMPVTILFGCSVIVHSVGPSQDSWSRHVEILGVETRERAVDVHARRAASDSTGQ